MFMNARQRAWVGQRIKARRRGLKMTQQALADEIKERSGEDLKIGQSTISVWEKGRATISLRYQPWLFEALEITEGELFENPPAGWREDLDERAAA